MKSTLLAWLTALCMVTGFGCTDGKTQVMTGRVTTQGAIAVRAISGDTVVTAARVRSDGTFTLSLPSGRHYRLEVLTSSGVRNVVGTSGGVLVDLAFEVCQPSDPFDLGGFGTPCDPNDPMKDPNCLMGCDPSDPNCVMPCDPSDPNCVKCQPGDPNCPLCDPSDPNCTKCQPGDPNCPPPPCDPMDPNCVMCDPTDPTCGKCDPADPSCFTPCDTNDPSCVMCDPSDPNCVPPCDPNDPMCQPCDPTNPDCKMCLPGDPNCGVCDPTLQASCPTPPPPCMAPTDPNTCKDPCMEDPAMCGCDPTAQMSCWPPPAPCATDGTCMPDGNLTPEHVPGNFGCKEVTD